MSETKGTIGAKFFWVSMSLVTASGFGLGNSAFGHQAASYGVLASGLPCPTFLVLGLIVKTAQMCRHKSKTGKWIDLERSNLLRARTRSLTPTHDDDAFQRVKAPGMTINWANFMSMALGNALVINLEMVMLALAFDYALLADLNQGCLSALFCSTCIFVAISFYFIFGERITFWHFVGMGLLLASLYALTADPKADDEIANSQGLSAAEKTTYGVIAVGCAIGCAIFLSVRNYFAKLAVQRQGYDGGDLGVDCLIVSGLIGTLLTVWQYQLDPPPLVVFLEATLAGTFFFIAQMTATLAMAHGPGGPVQAIFTLSVAITAVVNQVLLGQIMSGHQIAGTIVCVLSTVSITSGEDLQNALCPRKKGRSTEDALDTNLICQA